MGSVNLTIKSIDSDNLFLVLILTKRNRTSAKDIGYGLYLYLYFLGLSYRNTAKALSRFVKNEATSLSGNGFKNINLKEYHTDEEKFLN